MDGDRLFAAADDVVDLLTRRGFDPAEYTSADAAVRDYQRHHGLPADGQVGAATYRSLTAQRCCGLPDVMALRSSEAKWPDHFIRYHLVNPDSYRQLTAADVRAAWRWAFDAWAGVCDFTAEETNRPDRAHLVVECSRIDRAGGVLAESELADGTNRQKGQRYDSSEDWVFTPGPRVKRHHVDLGRVVLHEGGHAMGEGHLSRGNVLQAMYDDEIWLPQTGDVEVMVRRYGKPKKSAPPPETPRKPWTITISGVGDLPTVVTA